MSFRSQRILAAGSGETAGSRGSAWAASRARRAITRADQAVVIADAMVPFCGIGFLLFALVAGTQFTLDVTPGSWASSSLAAATSAILGIAFVLLRSGHGEFIRKHALAAGSAAATLVALNPIVYIIGTRIAYPAIGMLLVIVALGALLHDWFWATIAILALDLVWIICAYAFGIPVAPATFVTQMLKANALAFVLNVTRTRTVQRFQQAQREVHRMATTDQLTGLANQRGLIEATRVLPPRLVRESAEIAVVYVDVDDLKSVNDARGHAAGDALIRTVADVLRRAFRPHDTIARVGGDEFAVVLAVAGPSVAQSMVDRVNEQLAEHSISASIGTASAVVDESVDVGTLLERADAAMYAAKLARKNSGG